MVDELSNEPQLEELYVFFFNDTATTEIYTLSLHDALPISGRRSAASRPRSSAASSSAPVVAGTDRGHSPSFGADRKSTRLNSSHANISYAVFCLKKKKHTRTIEIIKDRIP